MSVHFCQRVEWMRLRRIEWETNLLFFPPESAFSFWSLIMKNLFSVFESWRGVYTFMFLANENWYKGETKIRRHMTLTDAFNQFLCFLRLWLYVSLSFFQKTRTISVSNGVKLFSHQKNNTENGKMKKKISSHQMGQSQGTPQEEPGTGINCS